MFSVQGQKNLQCSECFRIYWLKVTLNLLFAVHSSGSYIALKVFCVKWFKVKRFLMSVIQKGIKVHFTLTNKNFTVLDVEVDGGFSYHSLISLSGLTLPCTECSSNRVP